MSNDHCELAGNISEKDISFCGNMMMDRDIHVGFEMVDYTFNNAWDLVKIGSFIEITLDFKKLDLETHRYA